jgi:diaminopimelate decarboxylase
MIGRLTPDERKFHGLVLRELKRRLAAGDALIERDRFVVAPGHEDEQLERVVERDERYLVVDKFGEAERIAEAEERRDGVE